MAQLAILGHKNRGKEVIEILEMLGGKNDNHCCGNFEGRIYFLNDNGYIESYDAVLFPNYIQLTLEDFLEKFPYKVGDKVCSKYLKNYKIDKMEWENRNNRVIYKLQGMGWYSAGELQPYKEQETMSISGTMKQITDIAEKLIKIDIPKGYEFAGVDDDNQQVVFEKIGCQYPKTYEECCKILFPNSLELGKVLTSGYNCELLKKLGELLICRDAYWKIAGDWNPDWKKREQPKFIITIVKGGIELDKYYYEQKILAFPTKEMRDAFYENFKKLIETCKQLL